MRAGSMYRRCPLPLQIPEPPLHVRRPDLRREFICVFEEGEDDALLVAEQVSSGLTLGGGGRGPERDGAAQGHL